MRNKILQLAFVFAATALVAVTLAIATARPHGAIVSAFYSEVRPSA